MKIETLEISGLASVLQALRLPYGKDARSRTTFHGIMDDNIGCPHFSTHSECYINEDDLKLLSTLVKRGDEHAKVIRGIMVYAKITAPVFFFCEEECYRAGHERLSSESTMHIDCRGLSGDELQQAKAAIPMGKELTKVDMFSYQCLRNIYRQRRNHRLREWTEFCSWIENELPYSKELITVGICEL